MMIANEVRDYYYAQRIQKCYLRTANRRALSSQQKQFNSFIASKLKRCKKKCDLNSIPIKRHGYTWKAQTETVFLARLKRRRQEYRKQSKSRCVLREDGFVATLSTYHHSFNATRSMKLFLKWWWWSYCCLDDWNPRSGLAWWQLTQIQFSARLATDSRSQQGLIEFFHQCPFVIEQTNQRRC